MDAAKAYVITWACICAAFLIYKWPERLLKPLLHERTWVCRAARGVLGLPSRTLYIWSHQRITLCHYMILSCYVLGNGLLFVRPEWDDGFRAIRVSPEETRRRAAVLAGLNLAPVVLGGRTCLLLDSFNISLQHYYFAHHWLARLAIVEMTVHAALHVQTDIVWTAQAVCGLTV